MYLFHCFYSAMSQSPKQLQNFTKNSKQALLQTFSKAPSITPALILLSFPTFALHESGTRKDL